MRQAILEDDGIVRLAWRAMNTEFELAIWGGNELHLHAAADEVMREIKLWEDQLSFYRETSDIYDLNARAAFEPVPVEPRVFGLLQRAKELSEATGGAFDITVAPLLRAWGFTGQGGRVPTEEEIEAARAVTGMNLVEFDSERFTVRFLREGVQVDLGAIGKGFAIEQAAILLRDLEIGGGLLHGGTSTVQAIGAQPDGAPWQVAIRLPNQDMTAGDIAEDAESGESLALVHLQYESLSVSAPHGKAFTSDGIQYGHVLDPRIGHPVEGAILAAVICDSATGSDALSTALLVLGKSFMPSLGLLGVRQAWVVNRNRAGDLRVVEMSNSNRVNSHGSQVASP